MQRVSHDELKNLQGEIKTFVSSHNTLYDIISILETNPIAKQFLEEAKEDVEFLGHTDGSSVYRLTLQYLCDVLKNNSLSENELLQENHRLQRELQLAQDKLSKIQNLL